MPPRTARAEPSPRLAGFLDELVTLFLREGFAGLTLDEIATRLRCSKASLYRLAASKEQLTQRVVARFFARATERVERQVARAPTGLAGVAIYLRAVARELAPASPRYFADVAGFAPAAEVYRQNTAIAAGRVRTLIDIGVADGSIRPVNAAFVGAAVAAVMSAIQSGEFRDAASIDDGRAYAELATLVTRAVAAPAG
jgi:AcrR family transcriptional regulator